MRRAPVAIAGAIAALLAAVLAAAPGAQADQSAAIDPQRLMSASDIPRVLGRFPAVSTSSPVDPIITLCQDANYALFSVPAPQRLTSVTTNSSRGRLYRSITEDVYRFDSPADSATAFAGLVTEAARCTGTSTRADDSGATTDVRLTTGRIPSGASSPAAPVWTQQRTVTADARPDSPLAGQRDILHRVFTRSGDAIIVTTAFVNGAASMRPAQVSAVHRLAVGNAARYAPRR